MEYEDPSPEPTLQPRVTLADCPPGLFEFDGTINLKTEYATESPRGSRKYWPEAYCGGSGGYFWGGTSTHQDRAKLMVRPLDAGLIETGL
jgi:hypothetical protein